jgi:uncharacterized membrane protein
VDDPLRAQQTAADRVRALGVQGVPAAAAVEQISARRRPQLHFVPAVGNSGIRRYGSVASSWGETHLHEHFDPLWKLAYMWEHPLHFPLATWTAVTVWGDRLWPELIGILGWQDIPLWPWTYFVLTVFLVLVPLQKLNLDGAVRARVAVITGLAVLGYVMTVYLIFFLTYTPLNIDHVRGVQGRYFVIALPMAAIFLTSVINSDLPRRVVATIAITGSLLSGITSFQALHWAHWSVP